MRPSDRFGIAIIVSMILASFTLRPLTQDSSYLGASWLLIVLIALVGMLCRRTPLGSLGALVGQVAVIAFFMYGLSSSMLDPGPSGPGFAERVATLFTDAAEHMRTQAAPMEPNLGVEWLFIISIGVITLITDLLVVTLRKPALGLAPPLTLFLIPAIGLSADTGIRAFLCIAVGYCAILLAEGLNTGAGWTRGLSRDSSGGASGRESASSGMVVWRAGAYVAVPAIVLSVIAATATPTLALSGWGIGEGGGSGPLRLSDPTLDLKRNLTLPENRVVMTYRTNKSAGTYLRMASLPAFSDNGWQNAETTIDTGNRMPPPPGLTEPTGEDRQTSIQIGEFGSEYLPVPFAPRAIDAPGNWGYDRNSLVVISASRNGDRNRATMNLNYSVTSRDIDPDPDDIANALAGEPPDADQTTEVPEDLPQNIRRLAERITEDADTPAEQAAAIQAFLRDTDNFTYSLDPRPGSGYQALENFLFGDRQGYCEQFAAAMAVMARVVGIPSRVAVGFLPGNRNGDVWTVSAQDAHAWPELYLSGYGWVRYEPTPASVTGTAPSWTLERDDDPSDTETSLPDPGQPTNLPTTEAPGQQPTAPIEQPTTPIDTGFPWGRVLGFTGTMLLVLAVLGAPAMFRWRRRQIRLGDGFTDPAERVEAGWAEIRDTARDLRKDWPASSPRSIATSVGRHTDAETQRALLRLSRLVEQERYARTFGDATAAAEVPALVTAIRRGLLADRSRRTRLAITLFPRSLFGRR